MIPDDDREVIESMKFSMKKVENGYESLTNLKAVLNGVQSASIFHFPKESIFSKDALFIYGGQSNFGV